MTVLCTFISIVVSVIICSLYSFQIANNCDEGNCEDFNMEKNCDKCVVGKILNLANKSSDPSSVLTVDEENPDNSVLKNQRYLEKETNIMNSMSLENTLETDFLQNTDKHAVLIQNDNLKFIDSSLPSRSRINRFKGRVLNDVKRIQFRFKRNKISRLNKRKLKIPKKDLNLCNNTKSEVLDSTILQDDKSMEESIEIRAEYSNRSLDIIRTSSLNDSNESLNSEFNLSISNDLNCINNRSNISLNEDIRSTNNDRDIDMAEEIEYDDNSSVPIKTDIRSLNINHDISVMDIINSSSGDPNLSLPKNDIKYFDGNDNIQVNNNDTLPDRKIICSAKCDSDALIDNSEARIASSIDVSEENIILSTSANTQSKHKNIVNEIPSISENNYNDADSKSEKEEITKEILDTEIESIVEEDKEPSTAFYNESKEKVIMDEKMDSKIESIIETLKNLDIKSEKNEVINAEIQSLVQPDIKPMNNDAQFVILKNYLSKKSNLNSTIIESNSLATPEVQQDVNPTVIDKINDSFILKLEPIIAVENGDSRKNNLNNMNVIKRMDDDLEKNESKIKLKNSKIDYRLTPNTESTKLSEENILLKKEFNLENQQKRIETDSDISNDEFFEILLSNENETEDWKTKKSNLLENLSPKDVEILLDKNLDFTDFTIKSSQIDQILDKIDHILVYRKTKNDNFGVSWTIKDFESAKNQRILKMIVEYYKMCLLYEKLYLYRKSFDILENERSKNHEKIKEIYNEKDKLYKKIKLLESKEDKNEALLLLDKLNESKEGLLDLNRKISNEILILRNKIKGITNLPIIRSYYKLDSLYLYNSEDFLRIDNYEFKKRFYQKDVLINSDDDYNPKRHLLFCVRYKDKTIKTIQFYYPIGVVDGIYFQVY